jgi:hypothetical protein
MQPAAPEVSAKKELPANPVRLLTFILVNLITAGTCWPI